MASQKHSQQAVLLMAYGTPERTEDIQAYYTDVRRGKVPDEALLKELQERYAAIGGTTPLRKITEEQAKMLEERLGVPTFVGMKHWHPYIKEAVHDIVALGVKDIIALALAPHYSMMSIGDYSNRLNAAISEIAPHTRIQMIEQWGDNLIFIDSLKERMESTRQEFSHPHWNAIEVVFTAHSLPTKILEAGDPYKDQLLKTCRLVAEQLQLPHWKMAFQSAGRTRDTWLGPDILTELHTLSDVGKRQVLDVPIGFTTDNLEILYDLDIQAAEIAKGLGITFKRIPSANTTTRFIDALENVVRPFLF